MHVQSQQINLLQYFPQVLFCWLSLLDRKLTHTQPVFIYVYLLSCCYFPNWSPFNRMKPQAGEICLHSVIMIKKTPAFFILHVANVHPPYLNIPHLKVHPPHLYRKFSIPPIKLFLKIFIAPPLKKGSSHYDWFQHPNRMAF